MTFPQHERYIPSGVDYMGDIPAHWKVRRLKQICETFPSNVDKKSEDGQVSVRLCNYTDVYYNDEITADLDFMVATATPQQVDRFTLRSGDTIVTKDSETADDIAIAAYVPNDLPGVICGYHLAMIRPRTDISGKFVKRFFDSSYARASFTVRANGLTRVALGSQALANVDVPVPPASEQRGIVRFLDRETARIDTLIAKQERLIELLKEKRQALITQAVTKGLDPTVPMKDSSLEWLGELPAHWHVQPLKRFSPGLTVGIVVEPSKHYVDSGVPTLRSLNIRPGAIDHSNLVYISDESNRLLAKSILREGDLVAVRTGQPGTAAVVPPELDGCNCIDLIVIRKPIDGSSGFLCWYLASDVAVRQFSEGSGGAIQQHFNIGTAMDLVVTSPPLDEQSRIASYLDAETSKIDHLINCSKRMIELSKEHRASLISAAVTGKIDIRAIS